MKTTLELPTVENIPISSFKWDILSVLWSAYGKASPTFSKSQEGWVIEEFIEGSKVFSMRRDYITKNRYTDLDTYGLLGLSTINLRDYSVILTEGVSDYISTKLCNDSNVLGVTNLGGSIAAKKILISLFEFFTIVADNDTTGIQNAFKWKSFLESKGKHVELYFPEAPAKDITDEFIFNIKLQCAR